MEKFNSLYWYNSVDIFSNKKGTDQYIDLPGYDLFRNIFLLFTPNMSIVDRTGSIVTPVNVKLAEQCALPAYDANFSLSYDEICQGRARKLLDHVQSTGQKLTVLYSGGIDSTLMLVSLLKTATQQELTDHVLVLLSDYSINENPRFYYDHVIKRFNCASSYNFRDYIGRPGHMIITGEGNDQLFGSVVMSDFSQNFGEKFLTQEYTDSAMIETIHLKTQNQAYSESLTDIFNKIFNNSPVDLPTIFHRYWWINFTIKWQSVYMRLLAYTRPEYRANIILGHNYDTFFHIPATQQWSMKNTDRLLSTKWLGYKQECKDIIYDYNGDQDYRDRKAKYGSLYRVVTNKKLAWCFDEQFNFYDDCYPDGIWNESNDFI